jgi:hypothetical protein
MDDLAKAEIEAFAHAEKAYFKACESSDPQHWMEAALLAQQHRNALRKLDVNKYESYR